MKEKFDLIVGHRAMLEKRIYFLMAAAGACIGFALTQVKDMQMQCIHIAIGVALCLWAVSFWYGHKSIDALTWIAGYNVDLLEARELAVQGGRSSTPVIIHKLIKEKNQELEKTQGLQVSTLLLGVLAFVIWQTLSMVLRAI